MFPWWVPRANSGGGIASSTICWLVSMGLLWAVGGAREEDFALSPTAHSTSAEIDKLLVSTLPVETFASSVSVVVEENKILQLPLANRDIYSLFLLQPGVSSQGATVGRGLTYSVHRQRVSGSNYLLGVSQLVIT